MTAYGYDTPGRLQTITDALNHATTYAYDSFNRLASRTNPLGPAETFLYDVNGNPSHRADRKGQVTTGSPQLPGHRPLERPSVRRRHDARIRRGSRGSANVVLNQPIISAAVGSRQ